MSRKVSRTLKIVVIALPLILMLTAASAMLPRATRTQDGALTNPGTQITFRLANNIDVAMCGLQVKFSAPPISVLDQVLAVHPFKDFVPIIESNVIYFSNGCVEPKQRAEIKLTNAFGISVVDYYWVKEGVLIAGNSPVERQVETVTIDKVPLEKTKPAQPLVTVRFEVNSPPYGKIMVAQEDSIYENGLIALKDVRLRDQLMSELAQVKKASRRNQLEEEIASLEVRAPINGVVKELEIEVDGAITKVTLKVLQTALQS